MIERITAQNNPHFFLLSYHWEKLTVQRFTASPNYFFVEDIIEKRKPLKPNARRAGWVGCNILVGEIPQFGKIDIVQDEQPIPKKQVLDTWRRTTFLEGRSKADQGWTVNILRMIDKLSTNEFSLKQAYTYEKDLKKLFPQNNFIRAKIRQQLQVLRDQGVVEFLGRGRYRRR